MYKHSFNFYKKVPKGIKDGFMAIIFGILLGTIFILIAGYNPLQVFYLIGTTWARTNFMIGDLLSILSFYIIAGSAAIIASRAGLFNIGIGGQMLLGAVAAYMFAFYTAPNIPKTWSILISLVIAGGIGMILSIIIILLKIFFNIHEVLSSIMINWIVFYGYKWLFNSSSKPWVSESLESVTIDPSASLRVDWLTNLFPGSQISLGIIFAIITVIVVYVILRFTVFGKKIKMVGLNGKATKYAGVSVNKVLIQTMALSGILAGISGIVFFFGVNQSIPYYTNGIPNEYFNAIAVAMLAGNNPIGIIFSGFIFSMIYSAQNTLSVIGISFELSQLLLSVIMYSIALSALTSKYHLITYVKNKVKQWKEKKIVIQNYSSKGGD